MKAREFDPSSLAVAAFAAKGGQLTGRLTLADLRRLAEDALPALPPDADGFDWSVAGELRAQRAEPAHVWLHLRAGGALRMVCQRCLEPMPLSLTVDRWARFVHGETEAVELDADSEDDVLALSRSFDAMAWLEDELLLAMPAVVRHDACPNELPMPANAPEAEAEPERQKPFDVLAGLKPGA